MLRDGYNSIVPRLPPYERLRPKLYRPALCILGHRGVSHFHCAARRRLALCLYLCGVAANPSETGDGIRMKFCPQCESGYSDNLATCPLHGVPLAEMRELRPGMTIRETYRIVRRLGKGGMGDVYLAEQILLGEPQVLKFLSGEQSRNQELTGRFLLEVRTLRQIRHKNVVQAISSGPRTARCSSPWNMWTARTC